MDFRKMKQKKENEETRKISEEMTVKLNIFLL
jgi:hypothetical protein